MHLMIDIGNTRIKHATFLGGRINEKGVHEGQCTSKLVQRYLGKIKSLMLSSVKPIPSSILHDAFKLCPNYLVLNSDTELPFINQYETKTTIGSDRLALVAGGVFLFPQKPTLIIDAGTCITFDFIDQNKNYLGGAISPGLKMRLKALNTQTGTLPKVELSNPKNLIGSNTKQSILSGVVNGAIKEVDGTIDSYKLRYPDVITIVTGGDAEVFDKKLKNSIFVDKEILLKGMYFILKKHASKQM